MKDRLHHFVPQFYLKRFVGSDGLLWVYDKDSNRVFQTNPKNIAAIRGFYRLPEVFPDLSLMEHQFSELEQQAQLITEDWITRFTPGEFIHIPSSNREVMSLYISLQLLRTSEARNLLIQAVADSLDTSIDEGSVRELHLGILWDEEFVSKVASWVNECAWVFRQNRMSNSLYTSDDPFKIRSKTKHLHWAQATSEGAYLLIPLTPRILMYCFDPQKWGVLKSLDGQLIVKPLEPELVRDANIQQVGHAQRFVFSDQDNFEVARDFCLQNPGCVGRHRQRFEGGIKR